MKVNELFNEKYTINFEHPDVERWVTYTLNWRRRPNYKTWVNQNTIIKRIKLRGGFSDMVFTNRKNFVIKIGRAHV